MGIAMSVFGHIGEEMPKYDTVETTPQFEIRKYGPVIVAETTFQGKRGQGKGSSEAFWALANYIGVTSAPKNVKPGAAEGEKSEAITMTAPVIMQDAGEKIAMTAPVIMEEKDAGGAEVGPTTTMQFVLPSKFTMETVPKPLDPRVTVKEVPGKKVGAFTFNGSWTNEQVEEKAKALKEALEAAGHKPQGTFMGAFYNSPFTISFFRRNEVWYELSE